MNLKRFDGWEQESLKLFREQDLEILLDNFVKEDEQDDFLHNLADMLFRLKENLTKHNNDLKKVCLQCGGTGIMGNEENNAECDSCLGTDKPIIKS